MTQRKECPNCKAQVVVLIHDRSSGQRFCHHCHGEKPHCKRSTGTERAWFHTREEAEAFANDPANPVYHGDVAHLCGKCDLWHLSHKEWLEPQFTNQDAQLLEDTGIEGPARMAAAQRERDLWLLSLPVSWTIH